MLLMFFLIIVYIILAVKPLEAGVYNSCMDKDNIEFFRGIGCLVIILLHVSQTVQSMHTELLEFPYSFFLKYGSLPVCFFFFCSGYGLIYNLTYRADYTKGFLTKRLGRLLIPLFFASLLIIPFKFIHGGYFESVRQMCLALLLDGLTPVEFSWYVFSITYFYLCFWLISCFTKKPLTVVVYLSVCAVLCNLLCRRFFPGKHWTLSTFAFPMGAVLALIKDKAEAFLRKNYRLALLTALAFILLAGQLKIRNGGHFAYEAEFCAVILLIMLANMKFRFSYDKKIFSLPGRVSYEAYIVQELAILLLVNRWFCIRNGFVLSFAVPALSLFFGLLIQKASGLVYKLFERPAALKE